MVAVSGKVRVRESRAPWQAHEAVAYLLDVNVLMALLDSLHPFHLRAHDWFNTARASWASCNLTENGALRILSHPNYRNVSATTGVVANQLAKLCTQPGHRFWPGDVSLLDSTLIDRSRLLGSSQVTDTWLLALAVKNGGQLASFDRRLVTDAVRGGREALHLIE